MWSNLSEITEFNSCKTLGCIISGPGDLFTFRENNLLLIISLENVTLDIKLTSILLSNDLKSPSGSKVYTLRKYSANIILLALSRSFSKTFLIIIYSEQALRWMPNLAHLENILAPKFNLKKIHVDKSNGPFLQSG